MSTTDEEMIFSSVNERTNEQMSGGRSTANDLYSQRHIAYFDPSSKFEHVQPIEQFENEDAITRMTMNDQPRKYVGVRIPLASDLTLIPFFLGT